MRNVDEVVLTDLELAARLHRELNSLRRDRPHSRRHEMSDGVLGAPLGSTGSARHHAFTRRESHTDSDSSCSDSDAETADQLAQQISDDDDEGACLDERYTSGSGDENEARFEKDRIFSSVTASSHGTAFQPPEAALPRTAAGRLALKRWKERLARDKDKTVEDKPALDLQGVSASVAEGPHNVKPANGTARINTSSDSEVVSVVNWKDLVKCIGREHPRFKPTTFSLPESFFRSAGIFVAGTIEGQRRPLGRPRKHPFPDPTTSAKRPRGRPPLPRPGLHSRSPASSSSPSRDKPELLISETPSSSRTEREHDQEVQSDLGSQETEPSRLKPFACSIGERVHKESSETKPASSSKAREKTREASPEPKQRSNCRRQISDSLAETKDDEGPSEKKRRHVQSASAPNTVQKRDPSPQDLILSGRARVTASQHSSEKHKTTQALLKQDEELALKLHRELNSRTNLSIPLPRPSRVKRSEVNQKALESPKRPIRDPSSDSSSPDEESDEFEMSSESEEEDSVGTAQLQSHSSSASSLDHDEMQTQGKKQKLQQAVREMGGGSHQLLSPMPTFVLGKENGNEASLVCSEKPVDSFDDKPTTSGRHQQPGSSNDAGNSKQPKKEQGSQPGPGSSEKGSGNMASKSKLMKDVSLETEVKLELKNGSHEGSDCEPSFKRISRGATSSSRGNKVKGGNAPAPAIEVKVCGTEKGERLDVVPQVSMAKDEVVEPLRTQATNLSSEREVPPPSSKRHCVRGAGSHNSEEDDDDDDGLAMLSIHTATNNPVKFSRLRKQQDQSVSDSPVVGSSGTSANTDSTINVRSYRGASSSKPTSQLTPAIKDSETTPTSGLDNSASMKLAVSQIPSQLKTHLESAITTMAHPSSVISQAFEAASQAQQDNSQPGFSVAATSNRLGDEPDDLPRTSDPSFQPSIMEAHSTCNTSEGAPRGPHSLHPTSTPTFYPSDKQNATSASARVTMFPTTPSRVLSQASGEVPLPHAPDLSGPSAIIIVTRGQDAAATNPTPGTLHGQTLREQTNPTCSATPPVSTPLPAPSRLTSVLAPTPETKIAFSLRASYADSPLESKQTAMSTGAKDTKGNGCRIVNSNGGGVVQDDMAKKRTSLPVDWRPLKKRLLDSVPLAEPDLPKMQVDEVGPTSCAKDERLRQEPHGKKKRTGKRAPRKETHGAGSTGGCDDGLHDGKEGGVTGKKPKGKEARTAGRGCKLPKNHIMELEDAAALMSVLSGRAMNQYALQ